MYDIRDEQPADAAEVETLLDAAFGSGRYAKTSYRLREGVAPIGSLCFTAWEGALLRGSLRFWPILIRPSEGQANGGVVPALLLGPFALHPDIRGQKFSPRFLGHGLDAAREQGHRLVILVGDESYYARAGFGVVPAGQLTMPGPVDPARLLVRELQPGAFDEVLGGAVSGEIVRGRIDVPVAATSAPLAQPSQGESAEGED